MIIETMEQLGKCIDDGVELEMYFPDPSAHWGKINRTLNWGVVPEAVEEGRIRTKPRTVEVRLYFDQYGDPCQVDLADEGAREGVPCRKFTIVYGE